MTGRETLAVRRLALAGPHDRPTPPGSTSPRPGRARRCRPTDARRRTRAACASGSASPRRWSVARASCCSTSRSARSTRSAGAKSSTSCRELKGETTVFYSTHILDDVQRVSDHVAILDQGRLVRAAPTAELLADLHPRPPSGRDRRRRRTTPPSISPSCPASSPSRPKTATATSGPIRSASTTEDARRVQREVTRFASERDLTLTENGLIRLDLEDIFLRLIDSKERAA